MSNIPIGPEHHHFTSVAEIEALFDPDRFPPKLTVELAQAVYALGQNIRESLEWKRSDRSAEVTFGMLATAAALEQAGLKDAGSTFRAGLAKVIKGLDDNSDPANPDLIPAFVDEIVAQRPPPNLITVVSQTYYALDHALSGVFQDKPSVSGEDRNPRSLFNNSFGIVLMYMSEHFPNITDYRTWEPP
jgi:hypothetical protein